MKMSTKNKIRIRKRVIRYYTTAPTNFFTASWTDPVSGETHKASGISPETAYYHLKGKLKATIHVNDRTIPFYKFWKRRYTL